MSSQVKLFLVNVFLRFLLVLDRATTARFNKLLKNLILSLLLVFFLGILSLLLIQEQTHKNVYKAVATLIVPTQVFTAPLPNRPKKIVDTPVPAVTARAVLIKDLETDATLLDINFESRLPPASTTKLMTALIARSMYTLNESLVVPEACTVIESQNLGLIPLEKIMVSDLLNTLLISSSGDAACTLANNLFSEKAFVLRMNAKAKQLGLKNTHFTNTIGLDDSNGGHFSSPSDLYLITKEVLKDPFLESVVKTKEYDTKSGIIGRKVFNTNELLWEIPATTGVKTGRTFDAREVLIYRYTQADTDILIIVMGSEDRFLDTKVLLQWVLENYTFG